MKRGLVLSALLAFLLLPSLAFGDFDRSAYRPATQTDLVKDSKANAGKKFVVTDPYQFCGSDFCFELRKTKINTRDYYCVTLGPLCLVRFYIRKDHPGVETVTMLKKGQNVTFYGTFDYVGSDFRYMIVDRFEVAKP
jgi:hypothetical protein